MSEMVERLVQAFGNAMHRNTLSVEVRETLARAAINVMREPTPRMLLAAHACLDLYGGEFAPVAVVHEAMIDAALGGPND